MIAHIRVPHFLVCVMDTDALSDPVLIHDSSRILDVSPETRKLGIEAGQFLNTVDVPESVRPIEFSLEEIEPGQQKLREQIQKLSPVAETLELGEFLVDVDDLSRFDEWFHQYHGLEFPLSAGIARTGWLARVISFRQTPGEFDWLDQSSYQDQLEQVEISEFWGLGPELMNTLRDVDLKWMGEILHLDEADLRKLVGTGTRVFEKLESGNDPRPMNVFSRPRSLSVELEPTSSESLYQQGKGALDQFQRQLEKSASLAYRLSLVHYDLRSNRRLSHEFTTPTDDVSILNVAWNRMADEKATDSGSKICLDMIVGDVENYHREPQEDASDLEILS